MCGRYSLTADEEQVQARFVARIRLARRPHVQILRPTQPVWALVHGVARLRSSGGWRWGLIPSWAKDKAIGQPDD